MSKQLDLGTSCTFYKTIGPLFFQNHDNSSLNLILPPDARYLPHGEKHREVITPLCPAIVRTQCPFSTSNNLTILSDDPVAM